MVKTFRLPEFNYEVEIGKVARQADGSVWLQKGATTVLATVVGSPSKDFPGFLPLTVEYREQFAAAGKIPGGYYKREGKPSDREVLTARLIDRAIRPLFPENYSAGPVFLPLQWLCNHRLRQFPCSQSHRYPYQQTPKDGGLPRHH